MVIRGLLPVLLFVGCLAAAAAETTWDEDYQAAQRVYREARGQDDLQLVLVLCRQALDKHPPESRRDEVQFLLGQAACGAGRWAEAVAALRSCLEFAPASSEYAFWLATACEQDGRTTLAVRLYRRVYDDSRAAAERRRQAGQRLTGLHAAPELEALLPAEEVKVPGGRIRHHAGEPFVAAVREAVGIARRRMADTLSIDVAEPITLILFRDAAEYQAFCRRSGAPRPEWSTACTLNGRIYSYPAAGERDGLVATLCHEYTHVALRAYADDRPVPCWIDEGCATLLAGQFPGHRAELRRSPHLIALEALLVGSFAVFERDEARLCYVQSKAMVEDLLHRHGPLRMRAFLRALGQGAEAAAAFESGFQTTMREFFEWWIAERADAL